MGSYGNCTSLLEELPGGSPWPHYILHPHQHHASTAVSLHPWQLIHLPFTAILVGVRCCHTVVLICIFLMTNITEHLFMCFLAIYLYTFFGKTSVQILFPFLNWVL